MNIERLGFNRTARHGQRTGRTLIARVRNSHWSHLVAPGLCAKIAREWLQRATRQPLTSYFGGGALNLPTAKMPPKELLGSHARHILGGDPWIYGVRTAKMPPGGSSGQCANRLIFLYLVQTGNASDQSKSGSKNEVVVGERARAHSLKGHSRIRESECRKHLTKDGACVDLSLGVADRTPHSLLLPGDMKIGMATLAKDSHLKYKLCVIWESFVDFNLEEIYSCFRVHGAGRYVVDSAVFKLNSTCRSGGGKLANGWRIKGEREHRHILRKCPVAASLLHKRESRQFQDTDRSGLDIQQCRIRSMSDYRREVFWTLRTRNKQQAHCGAAVRKGEASRAIIEHKGTFPSRLRACTKLSLSDRYDLLSPLGPTKTAWLYSEIPRNDRAAAGADPYGPGQCRRLSEPRSKFLILCQAEMLRQTHSTTYNGRWLTVSDRENKASAHEGLENIIIADSSRKCETSGANKKDEEIRIIDPDPQLRYCDLQILWSNLQHLEDSHALALKERRTFREGCITRAVGKELWNLFKDGRLKVDMAARNSP
ncbi:hypothetical protein B0H19DRAFT_1233146 [Mycena capillaripes]|nr:hypothetical protein B0H19DRAFT_1233146 [Mycena capillaripes]